VVGLCYSDVSSGWTCNLVIGTLTWTGMQNMVIVLKKEAKCMAKYASVAVFLAC
jgi:hypothetical protein